MCGSRDGSHTTNQHFKRGLYYIIIKPNIQIHLQHIFFFLKVKSLSSIVTPILT